MKIFSDTTIRSLGDSALTIDFGGDVAPETNSHVLGARTALDAAGLRGVIETVPAFTSLTVFFDPDVITGDMLTNLLRSFEGDMPVGSGSARTVEIPVLYDGPDLAALAGDTGMPESRIVDIHTAAPYRVYMLGFLPGFAYLGDVPETLRVPRLREPRKRVPAGSVAIADQFTAVYPLESPGGWRLIGRTPLTMFDHRADPPNVLAAGDRVTFRAIDANEFERLSRGSVR